MRTEVAPRSIKDTTTRFYDAIRQEYFRRVGIKKNGVRVYTDAYIKSELARKYYRSEKTIENILFNRV